MHTEHLFISWYTILDVGLKLDTEDYDDKEEYIQYSYCMHAYPYFFFRFMKSFHIEATVYQRLHKEHLLFACGMKKMEHKQRYEKEFVSVVSAFHIFSAFVMHITILLVKSCIVWSAIRQFKWVTHKGPRIHQWEAWGPNTTNTHK